MATDSTTTGFLAPSQAHPYDVDLENALHNIVVGITGIRGDLVRPRWTPEPPQQPPFNVDWVAFGIVRTSVDTFAYHKQAVDHADVDRDELLYVMHSFYGPNCHGNCERFRDGWEIHQNRDAAKELNMELVEVQEAVHLPALLKERWVQRVDTTVIYRRRTSRRYPVLTITSAQAQLNNEQQVLNINVNP